MKDGYIIIYTDPGFPFDKENVFFTSKAYRNRSDFVKNSGVGDCEILAMIPLRYYIPKAKP